MKSLEVAPFGALEHHKVFITLLSHTDVTMNDIALVENLTRFHIESLEVAPFGALKHHEVFLTLLSHVTINDVSDVFLKVFECVAHIIHRDICAYQALKECHTVDTMKGSGTR